MQLEPKSAALLRELLKQLPAAKQSRVVMSLPETSTKSVKGSPTELSSPSQPTQKRQQKEANFTPSSKQTSAGAPCAATFHHPKHTRTRAHTRAHTHSVLFPKTYFLQSSQVHLQWVCFSLSPEVHLATCNNVTYSTINLCTNPSSINQRISLELISL